jgi:hypothetical protein
MKQCTCVPTKNRKQHISNLRVNLTYKRFTDSDARIRNNWENFKEVIMFNVKSVLVIFG